MRPYFRSLSVRLVRANIVELVSLVFCRLLIYLLLVLLGPSSLSYEGSTSYFPLRFHLLQIRQPQCPWFVGCSSSLIISLGLDRSLASQCSTVFARRRGPSSRRDASFLTLSCVRMLSESRRRLRKRLVKLRSMPNARPRRTGSLDSVHRSKPRSEFSIQCPQSFG
jgi:hypothetical protein